MTEQQAKWASQHDWFVSFKLVSEGKYEVTVRHDILVGQNIKFQDYKELREWAGY